MTCTPTSGTCEVCQNACTHKPGWFLPGEAERTADLLGLTLADLFHAKLSIDWWEAGPRMESTTFVLSPAVVHGPVGQEFAFDPRGVCVFYKDGRCEIHEAKPYECAAYVCSETDVDERHLEVALAWREHQRQITELLGREPNEKFY